MCVAFANTKLKLNISRNRFIAVIKQKPVVAATTRSCGWQNLKNIELIIDFVT